MYKRFVSGPVSKAVTSAFTVNPLTLPIGPYVYPAAPHKGSDGVLEIVGLPAGRVRRGIM